MKKKFVFGLLLFITAMVLVNLNSCYYDNELYLYSGTNCDTVYTYNARVKAIADTKCATSNCHTNTAPAAGLPLSNYQQVRTAVESAGLLCSIRHASGCSPMPKNNPQLSACDIQAFEKWQTLGFPQ